MATQKKKCLFNKKIVILDTKNNRKLALMLFIDDAVKQHSAEQAVIEVMGNALLTAWKESLIVSNTLTKIKNEEIANLTDPLANQHE